MKITKCETNDRFCVEIYYIGEQMVGQRFKKIKIVQADATL